jgi:hypothetical protein
MTKILTLTTIALCITMGASACPRVAYAKPPLSGFVPGNGPVANVFAQARNQQLSHADIDAFIDPSVKGPDRQLAHMLMASMPSNTRGDFVYVDLNKHLVSNNPAILRFVSVRQELADKHFARARIRLGGTQKSVSWQALRYSRKNDFFTNCGPSQSYTGAYTRDVSSCGMTDGWGFVYVACNTTSFAAGDVGYLYMEIVGSGGAGSGTASEGGFQYNSDSSVQGYVRTSYTINGKSGYQQMIYSNPGYHFGCGQNLTITHGISAAANNNIYTMVGQLPSDIDPATQYVNMNSEFFYPDNYIWLWTPPGQDMTGPSSGYDAAGNPTPCSGCSVSKVTSIAQSNGFHPDGSSFGDLFGNTNAISWFEVIFGQYATSCLDQEGATCQIVSSPDPAVYYAGTEAFPSSAISQSNYGITPWGPYESTDGIFVGGGNQRSASHSFAEPLPPMPCSPDSDGECAITTTTSTYSTCDTGFKGPHGNDILIDGSKTRYAIYRNASPVKVLETTLRTISYPSHAPCTPSTTWAPGEPRIQYNDPNLP